MIPLGLLNKTADYEESAESVTQINRLLALTYATVVTSFQNTPAEEV
jgi:hypothetical protein